MTTHENDEGPTEVGPTPEADHDMNARPTRHPNASPDIIHATEGLREYSDSDHLSDIPGEAGNPQLSGPLAIGNVPTEISAPVVTRYRNRRFKPRGTIFLTQPTDGLTLRQCQVSSQYASEANQDQRVLIVGEAPFRGIEQVRAFAGLPCADGWEEHPRGHYFSGHTPTLRYRFTSPDRPDLNHDLEISLASGWFGGGEYTSDDCCVVWGYLTEMVADRFDAPGMLSTPAALGRDLFARTLGRREFPVLSMDLQELIRSTSGQGRIETFAPAEGVNWHERFIEYDGRLAYAGCTRELGHGVPSFDHLDEYEPMRRGRYRVTFTPPAGWSHVGLVPVAGEVGWTWPTEGRHTTWVDGVELLVAGQAGWQFTIHDRLLFPEHRGRPLDQWTASLVKLLDSPMEMTYTQRAMLRAAIRALILHGIGAFAGRPHKRSGHGPKADVPAGAKGVTLDRNTGTFSWYVEEPQAWPEMAHPEWSAAVWARQRARLLDAPTGDRSRRAGMLSVHRHTLLGVRTDALFMTEDPRWPDDGKVGRFTKRLDVERSYAPPTNNVELLALKGHMGGVSDD